MSTHLQWAIINQFNSADIKKAGSIWSKEKGHLKGKKSLKYCTLVNPGNVAVSANAEGGIVMSTTGHKKSNTPAKNVTNVAIKKNARATYKTIRSTVSKNNFRKDQKRAAVKKAAAILRAQKKSA
jgi:hypothetical protein